MYFNFLKTLIIVHFVFVKVVPVYALNKSLAYTELQATARALITENGKLLLVSNDGDFWYTPGGRLEKEETLTECIVREVKEETGIQVVPQKMLLIEDFFDKENKVQKIEMSFTADIMCGQLSSNWRDQGGSVKFAKFFSLEEIKDMKKMVPEFLKEGKWKRLGKNPYMGSRGR